MSHKTPATAFLPAARASRPEVGRLAVSVSSFDCSDILDMLPVYVLVLNRERQILFANSAFADYVNRPAGELIGLRPGEALCCVHAAQTEGGCGTTEYCRFCGTARAILASTEGRHDIQECRMSRWQCDSTQAANLQIFSYPFSSGGDDFVVLTLVDVSQERRLRLFERLFYHDLLDTSSGIYGLCKLLVEELGPEHKYEAEQLFGASSRLMDQIVSHKQLSAAENHEIKPIPVMLGTRLILNEIMEFYRYQNMASGKPLVFDPDCRDTPFESDKNLVYRVVSNLVRNALEASAEGETVTIGCSRDSDGVVFTVHNPAVMSEETKHQIFKRFYSTKGEGRGLGAYGAKLFAEQYLGGTLWFTSAPGEGTVFTLRLPLAPPQ